jgi:glycerophosphoryl diester phosphodiesterase
VTIAIAHRGDPVAQRENTLAAFGAAIAQGAAMLELDLRRSRDGHIVVLHDPTLERLWGLDAAIADLDLAEVRQLGQGDERIPTLAELLAAFDIPLMVDFTGPEVVEGALADVRQAHAVERALFVSGHVPALRQLRALGPEVRIGLTWVKPEPPHPALLDELDAEYWNPMFRLVTPTAVAAVHERGRLVSCWTVDETRHMERVAAAGVDAIVSNRIGDLRRFLS